MKKIIPPLITLFCFLVLWEEAIRYFHINEIVLPSPSQIALALCHNFHLLFVHTFFTIGAAVLGFILGGIVAYTLAILFVYSPTLKDALYPYAVALKLVPLVVLTPLIVLWFGNGVLSKLLIAAIVSFLPVLVNAVKGLESVSPSHLLLMRSLVSNHIQTLTKLRIPASMSYTFTGLKVASTMSLIGVIVMEFIGSTYGIGSVMSHASYSMETPLLFAAIFMISISGILLFMLVEWTARKLIFWETS